MSRIAIGSRTHAMVERCGSSSAGRAAAFQAACRGFDPRLPLQHQPPIAKSVREASHLGVQIGLSLEADARELRQDDVAVPHLDGGFHGVALPVVEFEPHRLGADYTRLETLLARAGTLIPGSDSEHSHHMA